MSSQRFEAIEVRSEWDERNNKRTDYLVGDWPHWVLFSGALVRDARPDVMRHDADRIVLTLANGSAVYRIDRYDEPLDRFECWRES